MYHGNPCVAKMSMESNAYKATQETFFFLLVSQSLQNVEYALERGTHVT